MNLKIQGATASYGQMEVLLGVDIEVGQREVVGLFGHNGAGKTTLLRVIAGLHGNAEYRALLGERRFDHAKPHTIARMGVLLVREGARVFEGLTVQEHLALGTRLGRLGGRTTRDIDEVYDLFPVLAKSRRRPAAQLSGGQRQALALGVAFAAVPACLLLDEPSTGLSPQALESVRVGVQALKRSGVAILVAEQNPEWLLDLADRAYLLDLGKIAASGGPSEFFASTSGSTGESR